MPDDDEMKQLADALWLGRGEINRKYRGHARKARLMINDLTYGLALIERGLGDEQVRDNWRKQIDRMWLGGRATDTIARDHLLRALDWAASSFEEPRLAGQVKKPRLLQKHYFAVDLNGKEVFLDMAWPEVEEAAQQGIEFLASFDPELAAQFPLAEFAKLLPIWIARGENKGRRGKEHRIDEALCAFAKVLGLPTISAEAMRRQRLAWEREWPEHRRRPRTSAAAE